VVVVRVEVSLDDVEARLGCLESRGIDELVAPHCVPPEFALISAQAFGEELLAPLGATEFGEDLGAALLDESRHEHVVALDLVLQLDQQLDCVPVAIRCRVLQPAEDLLMRLGDLTDGRLQRPPQGERRRQLCEIEHPVDLPVTREDVNAILQDHGPLHERDLFPHVDLRLEVVQVPGHLGDETIPPPVGEMGSVDREHSAQVGADLARVLRVVLGDPRVVDIAVLGGGDSHVRVAGHGCCIQVPVDDLADPVGGKRRAEPTEHVVALKDPVADVVVHR